MTETAPEPIASPADADGIAFLAYARSGDGAILDGLLRAHLDRAWRHAWRILGDAAAAEDAVQDAALLLVRSARRYDGAVPFAAWFGRLVHVAARRHRRAATRRRRREAAAAAAVVPPRRAGDDERVEHLRRAIGDLPERLRAPLDLHYGAGLPQEAVAAALGLSVRAVSMRIHRAKQRLQRRLGVDSAATFAALAAAPTPTAPTTLADAAIHGARAWRGAGALRAVAETLRVHALGAALVAGAAAAALIVVLRRGAPPPPAAVAPEPSAAPANDAWSGAARELLGYVDPEAAVRGGVDLEALRRHLRASPPFTALDEAPTVAHVADLVEQMSALVKTQGEKRTLAEILLALPLEARGAAWSLAARGAAFDDVAIVGDLGDRAGRAERAFADELPRVSRAGDRGAIGPFVGGRSVREPFLGFAGVHVAIAGPSLLPRLVDRAATAPAPPAAWTAVPVWIEIDTAPVIAALRAADPDGHDAPAFAAFLPRAGEPSPRCALAFDADAAGMRSTIRIDGLATPLRAVDPSLAAATPRDALATLAVGVDPASAGAWCARFGVALPVDLAAALTGDLVVAAAAGKPLPTATLVARIRDPAAVARLLDAVAPRGGDGLRRLIGAPQPVLVDSVGDVVVATTADALPAWTRTVAPAAAPAANAPAIAIAIDTPAALGPWLPRLWAMLPEDALVADPVPAMPPIVTTSGDVDLDEDALAGSAAARSCTIAVGPAGAPRQSLVRVVRAAADAWYVERWEWRLRENHEFDLISLSPSPLHLVPLAEARAALAGLRHRCGPEPEAAEPLPAASTPRWRRDWLPSLDAVRARLPRYALTARAQGEALDVDERGFPVAAAALAMAAVQGWAAAHEACDAGLRARRSRAAPPVVARHANTLALLARFAGAARATTPRPVVASRAAALAAGVLSAADAAALDATAAGAGAAVLWSADGDVPLVVPIEPGWWAIVRLDVGGVYVTDDRRIAEPRLRRSTALLSGLWAMAAAAEATASPATRAGDDF